MAKKLCIQCGEHLTLLYSNAFHNPTQSKSQMINVAWCNICGTACVDAPFGPNKVEWVVPKETCRKNIEITEINP